MALPPAGSKPLLLLLVLFSVTCSYGNQNQQFITSCGDIHNISFPFQLQGDPSNTCNDENYTLSCDEYNRTVLHVFSGKYYVQSITYTRYYFAIRLVDVGIQINDICSSFPLSSLSILGYHDGVFGFDKLLPSSVMFLSCENPVQSPVYINRTGCTNNPGETRFGNGYYSYVVAGDVSIWEVDDSCTVEKLHISSSPLIRERGSKLSLLDFNRELGYGFNVLYQFSCTECRERASSCFGDSVNVTAAVCDGVCSDDGYSFNFEGFAVAVSPSSRVPFFPFLSRLREEIRYDRFLRHFLMSSVLQNHFHSNSTNAENKDEVPRYLLFLDNHED